MISPRPPSPGLPLVPDRRRLENLPRYGPSLSWNTWSSVYIITGALTPLHKDEDQSPGYQAPDRGPFSRAAHRAISAGSYGAV